MYAIVNATGCLNRILDVYTVVLQKMIQIYTLQLTFNRPDTSITNLIICVETKTFALAEMDDETDERTNESRIPGFRSAKILTSRNRDSHFLVRSS
jgi:hypothetical protein